MKVFIYKAWDRDGTVSSGEIEAESEKEAAGEIFSRNLHLIHLEERKEKRPIRLSRKPFASRRKLSVFAEEWASLLEAGLTLTDSLSLLAQQAGKREKPVLEEMVRTISSGHGIGESFAKPRCFPPFFLSLLHVGEISGTLPGELSRIASYYEKEEEFYRKLMAALAYPFFVTLFALSVFIVALTFILPSFALLFQTLSVPLPPGAATALSLGLWLKGNGAVLLTTFLLLLIFIPLFLTTKEGKSFRDFLLYRSAFGRRLFLLRFCYTLAALLESGRTLSESLNAVKKVLGNQQAKKAVSFILQRLEEGGDFSEALKSSGFASPLTCHLVKVGMESGELPRFLNQAGKLLSRETERKISRFRSILEPSLLLFVGLMTAFLVFSIMLPVFRAAGSHLG